YLAVLHITSHSCLFRLRTCSGLYGKTESSSLTHFTGYANLSTHEGNEFFTDNQSQSGTAIFTGGRRVNLRKGLEQVFHFIGRNTDTSILYCNSDFKLIVSRSFYPLYIYKYFSRMGKLNSIANE